MKTTAYMILLGLLLLSSKVNAQLPIPGREDDPSVNFGFQAGVLFPSTLFRVRNTEVLSEGVTFGIQPQMGIQVGGMATFRLNWRRFQVHAGLMLLRRNFECSAVFEEQRRSIELRTTVYEVPLLLSYYQPLSPSVKLMVGTGVGIQTLPSDLGSNEGIISVFAQRRFFAQVGSLTMAGMEIRLPKGGGVYLGAAYSIVPTPLYTAVIETSFNNQTALLSLPFLGDYFAVVGRYYFD